MSTEVKEKVSLDAIVAPELLEVSKAIKDKLVKDINAGTISISEEAFKEALPEDVSHDDIVRVMKAIGDVTVAAQVAVTETAIDMFKENNKLVKVNSTVEMGSKVGHISYDTKLVTTGKVPGTEDEHWTKVCATNVGVELKPISSKRGVSKRVKDYFCEMAEVELIDLINDKK